MRALGKTELSEIAGGMQEMARTPMGGSHLSAMHPDEIGHGGGESYISWGSLQVSSNWWSGDPSGAAPTNSFDFFAQDGNAPTVHFYFTESNGFGTLQASTPSFNNDVPYTLDNVAGTPSGSHLEFGIEGTFHLGGITIEPQFGISTANPTEPQGSTLGGRVTVKW